MSKEASVGPCKVLLVDDDPASLVFVEKLLEKLENLEIILADNGYDAVELARKNQFAVAILDVTMPGIDGFETARRILALENNANLPILFATAINNDKGDILKGYGLGAADYMFKPLVASEVLAKVEKYASLSRQTRIVDGQLRQVTAESKQFESLLKSARDVLEIDDFEVSVRKIFNAAKEGTGATAGYVALLTSDGHENEVLFLDSGGRTCSVDENLPMPIRGLRGEAYSSGRTVYDNDFSGSEWMKLMPEGHVDLDNVLFAPLNIDGKVQGIIGLANKPGDFTDDDAQLASAFGNFAALSLKNSRYLSRLKNSRTNLEQAQRQAGMGSFVIDYTTNTAEWSEGMYEMAGIDPGKVNGHSPFKLLSGSLAQEIDKMVVGVENGEEELEKELKDVEVGTGQLKTIYLNVRGDRDRKGILRQILGSCLDITEKARFYQKLMASQRLEAVGQLVGGLAHEINTPLQYMASNLEFLNNYIGEMDEACRDRGPNGDEDFEKIMKIQEEYREELEPCIFDIRAGLDKISAIVTALQQMVPTPDRINSLVDINMVVNDLVTITKPQWSPFAVVEKDLCEKKLLVSVSQEEVYQALLNILVNSIQAIKEMESDSNKQDKIVITTGIEGNEARVSIADNGPGIPLEHRDKIFDPFFTTKEVGTGTGLGLALAHSVIQKNGGTIEVESESGVGTTFKLSFPAKE